MMIRKIFYFLFTISTVIILLNRYSDLSINNAFLYWILIFISYASFVFILNIIFKEKFKKASIILIIFIAFSTITLCKLTYLSFWKTQSIEYINIKNNNQTIDFQMRDLGALGFKRRFIKKTKLIPGIDWSEEIDTNKVNREKWKKTNFSVNELHLKY
ncbi:hypothetical protein EV144_105340 [Flavobacterium sp. 270]|uniref:hypothetical protein n=1 Tax=Flavobacterium sp. 270 TaxID=2512114 RepID=UPI001066094A|nr:hypothetical protein [Flavobacterium sp. 270]TDW47319.1 hypothetical protein EV144_105340 [Flavobacterium sp. 270]